MALFDLDVIKSAFFKEQAYQDGIRLLENCDIDIIDVAIDKFTDEKSITANLICGNKNYHTKINIILKGEHATLSGERSCDCDEYNVTKENCRHMATLINYLQPYSFDDISVEKLNSTEPSPVLIDVIDQYQTQLSSLIENNMSRITPHISFNDDKFVVSFYINKKYSPSYLIDDLKAFIELFKTKGSRTYSGSSEIIHDQSLFTPISQEIIRVLKVNLDILGEDKSQIMLDPDLYFMLFDNNIEVNLTFKNKDYRHISLQPSNHPFTLSVRQSGDLVKMKLISEFNDISRCGNCFVWFIGNELNYFLNPDPLLQQLLEMLFYQNLQLDIKAHLRFKIFVESVISEKINIDENLNYDFSSLGYEDIELNCDYQDDNVIIHMPQLIYLHENDFSKSIDYMKLIKIYQLLSRISVREEDSLIIKKVEDIYYLFSHYLDIIKALTSNVSTTPSFDDITVIDVEHVDIEVDEDDHSLILDVNIDELTKNEISTLLKKVNGRNPVVKLNNKIVNLNNHALNDLLQLCQFLSIDNLELDNIELPPTKLFLLENIGSAFKDVQFHFSQNVLSHLKRIKDFKVEDFNPGKYIDCQLRDYQVEGISYILSLLKHGYGAILADEMGLGKTIQALAISSYFIKENKKVLVTAPTSLVYNWAEEIKRFLPNAKTVLVVGEANQRRKILDKIFDYDIILTSYDLMKRDLELYETYNFDLFILDEAQFIKNFNTQNYKAITSIKAKHHLALTGTPIENGVKDLWSIINFIIPGYLGNYRSFYRFFEHPIMTYSDDSRLRVLKKLTAPFIIRRLKKDVLDALPSKLEEIVYNTMNQEQANLYHQYIQRYQQEIAVNNHLSKVELLSMIMRLRQIAIDPRLIEPTYPSGEKIKSLVSIILECVERNEKVLVFSQFVKMLDIVQVEMDKLGINYFTLTGKTSKEERHRMVKAFGTNAGHNVFFVSLKAGGTGLNLTSANHVVLVDPWWNKSVENQAADRAHRIGQQKDVYVKRLITLDTIEDRIMDIQASKTALSQNLLSSKITSLELLDIDELKDLIRKE